MNVHHAWGQFLNELSFMCDASMSSLHLASDDCTRLVLKSSYGLPDLWQDWIQELPWRRGIGAGVWGEAVVSRRIAIAPSLDDLKFDGFREVALAVGIRAMWALPILCNKQRVLGAMAVLYVEPRAPTVKDIINAHQITRRVLRPPPVLKSS